MSNSDNQLGEAVQKSVVSALQELLEEKFLYQHVKVSTEGVEKVVEEERKRFEWERVKSGPSSSHFNKLVFTTEVQSYQELLSKRKDLLLEGLWDFKSDNANGSGQAAHLARSSGYPVFSLPTIRIQCAHCDGVLPPHNSGCRGINEDFEPANLTTKPARQVFSIPYQCENCRGVPLMFMVKREGLKLTMVGRSQIALVAVPKFIPTGIERHFRNSVIAQQTGFLLAAALYLRCAIETHMRDQVKPAEKITGDELAEAYGKTLSVDFSGSFPSLKKAYSDLSVIIHTGSETESELRSYSQIKDSVEGHFEGLDVFKRRIAFRK